MGWGVGMSSGRAPNSISTFILRSSLMMMAETVVPGSMPAMVDDNVSGSTLRFVCGMMMSPARKPADAAGELGETETTIVHRLGSTSHGFPSSLLGGSCSTGAIWIPRKPAEPLFGFCGSRISWGDKFATAPRPCAPDENRGMLTSTPPFSSKICSMPWSQRVRSAGTRSPFTSTTYASGPEPSTSIFRPF